ncbi:MAG: DUF5063 domain-containing protein [Gammaproteobacteria bacterium]|nr:DUF5063 domain-containing protein [Gammaproteobacteria bacterium]
MPLQCRRMMSAAVEFCDLIDNFDVPGQDAQWMAQMEKLLPKLHVAVIALSARCEGRRYYHFPDDDKRYELYLRLLRVLQDDDVLWEKHGNGVEKQLQRQRLCDRLADDLTDVYSDLKCGLDLLEEGVQQAVCEWQNSFYVHWGQHLLDAECWLHAVGAGGEPPPLPGFNHHQYHNNH